VDRDKRTPVPASLYRQGSCRARAHGTLPRSPVAGARFAEARERDAGLIREFSHSAAREFPSAAWGRMRRRTPSTG